MLRKDYIMRLIEQIIQALAKIMKLVKAGNLEEALEEVKKSGQQYFGLSPQLLETASDTVLIDMLKAGSELDPTRCALLGMLLKEQGEVYEAMGDVQKSIGSYIKSLSLLLEALDTGSGPQLEGASGTVAYLAEKLREFIIPDRIGFKLFRYYERVGDFAAAEEEILEIIDISGTEYIEEGISFYERLLTKDDETLLRGNLPRNEVIEGMERLQEF